MDKALGDIGQHIPLQMVVAQTSAITEGLTVQANAARIVGNHLSICKFRDFLSKLIIVDLIRS